MDDHRPPLRSLADQPCGRRSGDRDDLWSAASAGGERLYVFVDDSDLLAEPITEDQLHRLSASSLDASLIEDPEAPYGSRGWFLELDAPRGERVVTPVTAISGVTVFSTFLPEIDDSQSNPEDGQLRLCAKRGDSRNYVVFTNNGNGVFRDADRNPVRYADVTDSLVSEPFIEQHQTANAEAELEPELSDRLLDVMEILKSLFPENCKFVANYRLDIKTIRSDTGVEHIAPVPICIIQSNWKEF